MVGRGLRSAPGKADVIVLDHAGATFSHGLVDDPIVWTLEEDRRAQNKAHASRGRHGGMPKMCTCPECLGVMFAGRPCPLCSWRPQPKPQDFETADGELCEVRRDRSVGGSTLDRARFHGMLLWIARDKGYKPGWAGHKFKEKFGTWPADRYVMPIPPDDSVRAWVRSRQIAFAKAMEKAGAA
jgi:DNA repair protein RadD